jgi:hypothetical protein
LQHLISVGSTNFADKRWSLSRHSSLADYKPWNFVCFSFVYLLSKWRRVQQRRHFATLFLVQTWQRDVAI